MDGIARSTSRSAKAIVEDQHNEIPLTPTGEPAAETRNDEVTAAAEWIPLYGRFESEPAQRAKEGGASAAGSTKPDWTCVAWLSLLKMM
jgi:hypothetical protein